MNYFRYLKILFFPIGLALLLSCEGLELTVNDDLGVSLSNIAGETNVIDLMGGEEIAGDIPFPGGDFSGGMMQAGENLFGGDSLMEPDYTVAGTDTTITMSCGNIDCDLNAICIFDATEPYCECIERYEGDGTNCSPQPCPSNASGAPNCICDEGFSGELIYDFASRTWLGQCAPIITCTLITIQEEAFIETEDITFGQDIHEICIGDDSGSEYDRFSFEEGIIYHYHTTLGMNSRCPTIQNDHQVSVSSWPFSGGVLTDSGLFHASNLSYTLGECTYDILAVKNGPTLDRVYLAPTGRSCPSGEHMTITCGEGICRTEGEMFCIDGQWVEECTPAPPQDSPDICDGLDSDCDGSVDEDFVSEATTCGLGVCFASGETSCTQGRLSDSCVVDNPQNTDQNCDGLDNDCDGNIDENFVTQLITCGEGICHADGVILCQEGVEVRNCTPEPSNLTDDNCDGIDQDCDGTPDESYVGQEVNCGIGACSFEGRTRCINGVAEEACTPLEPAEDDSSCDGIDNDCDERIDEDYEATVIFCGLGVCATSGSTLCEDGVEQELCSPTAIQGNDSSCDGIDQDCDGIIDESFVVVPMPCSGDGTYQCSATAPLICTNGQADFDCETVLSTLTDATCDGEDDDCDGLLDENYISVEVSCGLGECLDTSMSQCTDGEVTDRCLERSPTGDDSDCDGRDDDCDGSIDESFTEQEISCGLGVCTSTGIARCIAGVYETDCEPLEPSSPNESSCDGIDNDCDGRIDEAYVSARNECGFGVCFAIGSSSCSEGVEALNCNPLPSTGNDADCDGLDQDCDDQHDEHYPSVVDECGMGVCYNTADSSCVEGQVQNNCVPLPETGNDADCDHLDNDCDGQTDEDYPQVQQECGVGVCFSTAFSTCVEGQVQNNCVELPSTNNDANCDGLDNDCDSTTDESYPIHVDSCGQGVCSNTSNSSCVDGVEQNNCVPLPETGDDSDCDGLDDDCDGQIDEAYVPIPTTCLFGSVCVQQGMTACVNGSVQDVCDPPAYYGNDNSCNNVDNDCDGNTDEHFIGGQYNCGNGVCTSTGLRSCVNGVESGGNCSPNDHLASSDNNCDGIDQDCDGNTDEHYGAINISCGTGVCRRNGTRRCIGGSLSNSCVQGDPTGDDTDNNGQDDDCDGQVDEDACQVTGNDSHCDNQDNDCDGRVDESFDGGTVSCGEGVCASTGVNTCSNGSISSTCTPNNQNSTEDSSCNNVDNDCDGNVDEHYNSTPTTCGIGACARTGQLACQNGSTQNTCVAGNPTAEIPNNGIDEDCNGSDLTGPVRPSGSQFTNHYAVKYTSGGFKAVWSGTGFTQQQAAQQLLGYFTGQGFGSSNTYYPLGFSIKLFYSSSPYNLAGSFGRSNNSRAKYFVDGIETVVQVENVIGPSGDIEAGPRQDNFIYQRQ